MVVNEMSNMVILLQAHFYFFLQCCDTVGWATGKASYL